MRDGLRINGVKHDRQFVTKPNLEGAELLFTKRRDASPQVIEQTIFANAILGKGEITVLPEQAAVVTRILEAIYESAKTGKPVYFD